MSRIINKTPHSIVLLNEDNTVKFTWAPEGKPIELTQETSKRGEITHIFKEKDKRILIKVPLIWMESESINLPEEKDDVYYIVSTSVKNAFPERLDFIIPNEVVRDNNGMILGYRNFS